MSDSPTRHHMVRGRCTDCDFVFDVISAPIPADLFVEAARGARCTICGGRHITLTANRPLTALEMDAKSRALARLRPGVAA